MFENFEILIWFLIILVASSIVSIVLHKNDLGPFNTIVNCLSFIGIVVHELSHYIICLAVGIRPEGIKIRYRNKNTGQPQPHGSVSLGFKRPTFLQSFLISFAPLYVSTWLFFFCLSVALNPEVDSFYRVVAGFLCFSLFMGAAPSSVDLKSIGRAFKYDYRYTMYQIFLVVFSGLLLLGLLIYFNIFLWYDFVFYIAVAIGYFFMKYSIKGVNWAIRKMSWSGDDYGVDYKEYTRKRFKSKKPRKSGIRTAQW